MALDAASGAPHEASQDRTAASAPYTLSPPSCRLRIRGGHATVVASGAQQLQTRAAVPMLPHWKRDLAQVLPDCPFAELRASSADHNMCLAMPTPIALRMRKHATGSLLHGTPR